MALVRSRLLLASLRFLAILSALALVCEKQGVGSYAQAQSPTLKPIHWQEKLFYIPYQANQNEKFFQEIKKVQLLLSRDGISDWRLLQEAKPNVKGFSYLAESDGDFWFAVRHIDRAGKAKNAGAIQPQLRIIVDTNKPTLDLKATWGATGEVVVRYEAFDINLDPATLLLEVRSGKGSWTRLPLTNHDVAQSDKLSGRVTWQPPARPKRVEVRATVADQAGKRAEAQSEVVENGPALTNSSARQNTNVSPQVGTQHGDPFLAKRQLPSYDWPLSNRLPPNQLPQEINMQTPHIASSVVSAPPIHNPYSMVGAGQSSGKHVVEETSRAEQTQSNSPQTLAITPMDTKYARPDSAEVDGQQEGTLTDNWTASDAVTSGALRIVNSQTFDVEYEIESVGPWGVSKVELWGTHDRGHTWQSYGTDPDNRSPLRVTVAESGNYGFRIVVHGAGGAPVAHPRSGDEPELKVQVDLLPPSLTLNSAELGQGDLAGHLLVTWNAKDSNLETRPIALYYSSQPKGPWSTIATRLENSGKYSWRIERHVPAKFYLRIEAQDTAGNVASQESPLPITLPRQQPTGRLRNVRPVAKSAEPIHAARSVSQK